MNKNNYVLIMAGGIGSRFWPMSRTHYPKQFLDILETGSTLLQSTYERFHQFINPENIYIVTSDEYINIVKEQLPHIPNDNIIGEPERKNTAPCIAYISMKLQMMNPNSNMIVAPSDHMIHDTDGFEKNCIQALNYTANNAAFVTLGIRPSSPNTGYGYIKANMVDSEAEIFSVEYFTEKPRLEEAKIYYRDNSYFWNSGIFIWKTKDILEAFDSYASELIQPFNQHRNAFNTQDESKVIRSIYNNCQSISIDYAIMEHAQNVFVIPAKFNWSDLGTWNSAWENYEKDDNNNASIGANNILVDSKGCMVHSADNKLLVLGGVSDLIIINTKDTLMICRKENEQQIKDYLALVKEQKGVQYI